MERLRHRRTYAVVTAIVILLLTACGGSAAKSRCQVSGVQLREFNAAYTSAPEARSGSALNEAGINAIIENNLALCVFGLKGYNAPSEIPQSNWVAMYMASQKGQLALDRAKEAGSMWNLPLDEVEDYAAQFYTEVEISPQAVVAEKLAALAYDDESKGFVYPTGNSAYISSYADWDINLGKIEANGNFIAFNIELQSGQETDCYTIIVRAYENGVQFEACYPSYAGEDPVIKSPERVMTTYHCPAAGLNPQDAAESLCAELLDECSLPAANRNFTVEEYSNLRCELSSQTNGLWRVDAFAEGAEPVRGRFLSRQGDSYYYFFDPTGKGQNPLNPLTIEDGKLVYMPVLQQAVEVYFNQRQENFDYSLAGVAEEQVKLVEVTPFIVSADETPASVNGESIYELEISEWNWVEYGSADTLGFEITHRLTVKQDSSGSYTIAGDVVESTSA